jgi:hypothetical protein
MYVALIGTASVASGLKRVSLLVALVVVVAVVAGCAGTEIGNESKAGAVTGGPSVIYVENFDLGAATLKADPGTLSGRPRLLHLGQADPAKKLEELSDLLATSLVGDLQKKGLPARRLAADAARPAEGWLVSGRVLEVVEGNRMQKAVVGFGAGDSDAQLYVGVADLARPAGKQDLLDFDVNSQGNKAPGGGGMMVATHTPYGMAAKYVLDRNASEDDVKRAARRIADELERLVQARGA